MTTYDNSHPFQPNLLAAVLQHMHRHYCGQWLTAKEIAQIPIKAGPDSPVRLAALVYFGADELSVLLEEPEFWVADWLMIHRGYTAGDLTLVCSIGHPTMWRVIRPAKPRVAAGLRAAKPRQVADGPLQAPVENATAAAERVVH